MVSIHVTADAAAGYDVLGQTPPDRDFLTTEFKINLVAPAAGDLILARDKVVKAGRTLTLAQTEVFTINGEREKLIALVTTALMAIERRDSVTD